MPFIRSAGIFLATFILLSGQLPAQTISFTPSNLSGENLTNPTSLQFGPDGRLYVAQQNGLILAYTVVRNGANNYQITATETITVVQQIPNHNDNGAVNSSVNTRQVTGIFVTGTAANPIIYVTSSDSRIGGNTGGTDTNLDTNSGIISRLTKNGNSWTKVDLVRGLPRSEENHSPNGLAYDAVNNYLYMAQGGNTNMGAPANNFALTPEYAYSTAILRIDLNAIGNTTYDLPTLDDETRTNVGGAPAGFVDPNDPFGGNDGKNQAMLVSGGPVQVYSPGWRNNYDVLITQAGRMYSFDNGPNAGWGGPPTNCSNAVVEPGTADCDELHYVTQGYYAGHANPTRGSRNNKFNTSNPQTPIPVGMENSAECTYQAADSRPGAMSRICSSTNGLAEYTASNFSNAMKGDLLAAAFNGNIYRFKLNAAGTAVVSGGQTTLASGLGTTPLDIIAQGDNGFFPGTIWICLYGSNSIAILEPIGFTQCTGDMNSMVLDADGDGYSNGDETANATNPCSAASKPSDFDNDHVSDLTDNDDDNDGINDQTDKFAQDATNGTNTFIPVNYGFDNSVQPGILGWGFTGLMANGSDYRNLFNPDKMTVGGAALKFTIEEVTEGDPYQGLNSQEYGFQFGLNVGQSSSPFIVHTRIMGPFAGVSLSGQRSMGMFIGTGDQDNYLKIVTAANGGAGGIEVLKEVTGTATSNMYSAAILNTSFVDLYLYVNKTTNEVQPKYSINGGSQTSLGSPVPVPASWLSNVLAVGFLATSINSGATFPATWDFIEAIADNPSNNLPQVSMTSPANNSTFTAPANLTVSANASSTNGNISKVDFFLNNSLINTDNTSPYSYNLSNVSAGNYTITAVATDVTNASATSSPVGFSVVSSSGGSALFIAGSTSLNSSDQAVVTRLQSLGFSVTTKSSTSVSSADASGKKIILISATSNSGNINSKFTNSNVPVICWEPSLLDDLKMTSTSSSNYGALTAQNKINIINNSHPLAAGLSSGNVTVFSSSYNMTWGNPGSGAVKIANIPGNSTKYALFGYETGTAMVGINAPARRVGFFLHDVGASGLTSAGIQLLDAAITWAAAATSGGSIPDCNGVPGGSAFLDDCGVCSGSNTGHTANSDKDACGVCFGNGSSCGGTCVPLQVVSFTLMKAGTAGEIGTLTEGMTIGLATVGSFSIRANICPGSTSVKSVKFVLNGATFRVESTAPYALNGDNPTGSYIKWNATAGSYTLVAIPYSGTGASGTAGVSLTRHFTLVNGAAKTEPSTNSNENIAEETFKIYPNPSNGQFMLEMGVQEQNDLNIRIYNQLGQIIYSEAKLQYVGEMKEQIVLDNQPAGIYFLQLTSGSKVFNEKLIIRN